MSDKNFKVKNGIDAAGKLTITNTSGTDSLIEVNGAGGGQFTITPYGGISTNAGFQSIGGPSYFGGYGGTTNVVVSVTGASGQTADLQRWTTFSGTVLAKVDSTGSISATDLTLSGNLTVNGTTTNLNSTNLVIEDKNIIIADVATPTDTTADGAGITIKGATDKTLNWVQSTGSFTSSEPFIINSNSASSKPLIIKGAASQTADLQQWQDSTGTVLAGINSTGSLNLAAGKQLIFNNGLGTRINLGYGSAYQIGIDDYALALAADNTSNLGKIAIRPSSATYGTSYVNPIELYANGQIKQNLTVASNVGLIIKGAASQTANLQEWQDSTGTILNAVANDGTFKFKNSLWHKSITDNQDRVYYEPYSSSYYKSANNHYFRNSADTTLLTINQVGNVLVNGFSASTVGLIVKGATSQTANLQEWQNNSGGILARVDQNGNIFATNNLYVRNGGNDYGAAANFGTGFNATKGFVLRGVASQTANLMEWQNSAATVLTSVDASGNITAPSYNLSDSKYLLRKTIKKTVDPAQNAVANNTYDLFDMNFPSSLQGTFYIQASIRGGGYGQNLTYSLPATYVMDWINQYPITNPFTNSTTWVDLTPLTFSPRHLMTNDYFKFQAKVNANQISFRIKLTGTLTGAPVFDIYIQHSEEFANSTITELNTTGTDATTSNVMPNFLSSKAGLSAIFNPITLYSNNSTNIPLSVRGAASQSVDLQQWYDGSGSMIAAITSTGGLGIGTSTLGNNSKLTVSNGGIKIASGGTAALDASLHVSTSYGGFDRLTQMHPSAASKPALNLMGATGSNGSVAQWYSWGVDTDLNWKINTGTSFSTPNLAVLSNGTVALNTTTSLAQLGIVNSSSSTVGLVIRGAASQSAYLQEWQNSSGTTLAAIGSGGGTGWYGGYNIFVGDTRFGTASYYSAETSLSPRVAEEKGLVIRGVASQTAKLQEWQNSAGTIAASISVEGNGYFLANLNAASIGAGNNIGGASLTASPWSAATVVSIIRGWTSQSADLTQWQNSSGTVLAKVDASGNFSAITKSFDIPHPTKENMRLRYASLEGPENGVYIRGTADSNIIELPEYWTGLVHEDSITVSLTAVGSAQNIYVEKIENNKVYIGGEFTKAFFTVYGERKDIDKLTVEY